MIDEGLTMKATWTMRAGLAVVVLVMSVAAAHAAAITPVGGALTPTITIFEDLGGGVFADITDTYLPEWAPGVTQTVYIVLSDQNITPTLVAPGQPAPATTALRGNCTNFGTDTGADFSLGVAQTITVPVLGQVTAFSLTSNDCGGTAVVQAGTAARIVLPRGADHPTGIPDAWRTVFCPGTVCAAATTDADTSPGNTNTGDGIAAFDEYRGFIVNGVHIRTDPARTDLFVRLSKGGCGGAVNTSPLNSYPTDGTSLFDNLNNLIPGAQIHVLGSDDEWVNSFSSATYVASSNTVTLSISNVITDRQINKNAIFPLQDTIIGNTIQKGLRVVECVNAGTATSPLGSASLSSPNGSGNTLIYTNRIINNINSLVAAGGTRPVKYFSYDGGVAVLRFTSASPPARADNDLIVSKAIKFILAMEVGHSVKLTPTVEGTRRVSYGYHHAPGSGSNLDQTIVNTLDTSFNNFYIPTFYNANDTGAFKVHN